MKRLISNIILFMLSLTVFACIYVGVFKISVTAIWILLVIFALYGLCMGLGWKSMEKLKKYEKKPFISDEPIKDHVKTLLLSLAALSPTYFCVTLVSLIPLYTYEVWFVTVLPCIFLNCLPANSVLGEYHELTNKKLPFLASFLILTAVFCLIGVTTSSLILKTWIV